MIIVSTVVGSVGLLSAILGFSAEGTKLTPYDIRIYGSACIYPSNPAFGLAICATIFLRVAQVMVTAVGVWCGCCKSRSRAAPSHTKRIIGIVCAVVSWIAAGVAWALLLYGAAYNANVARPVSTLCPYLNDGAFAGAAVLTLVATALGVTSYIMFRGQPAAAASSTGAPNSNPQLPPPQEVSQQQPSPSHPPAQDPQPQGHGEQGQAQFPPPSAPPEVSEQAPSQIGHHAQSSPALHADHHDGQPDASSIRPTTSIRLH